MLDSYAIGKAMPKMTDEVINELENAIKKMDMAMRARGYQPKLNGRTLFIASQRVALLLIHALVKAEKTEMALKARGFQLHDVKKTQDKS